MFFFARRFLIKRRSSLGNPAVVAKLEFARIKQNFFTLVDDKLRETEVY